jgi:hypothetical protein
MKQTHTRVPRRAIMVRRALLSLAALAVVAVAGLAGPQDAANARACPSRGFNEILSNRVVVVLRRGRGEYVSCVKASGELNSLDLGVRDLGTPPAVALRRYTVAFASYEFGPEDDVFVRVEVVDARGKRPRRDIAPDQDFGLVNRVVVRSNGSVAWSMSDSVDRILRLPADGDPDSGGEVLDAGRNVDARTLRLRGDYIYWTRAGKRHRALLK